MKARPQLAFGLACAGLLGGCSSDPAPPSAVERGRELFESKALTTSTLNDYTCATCHDTQAQDPPSKKAGSALAGATERPRFWGGQEADLLRSINACRSYFMLAREPLAPSDGDAVALYAYLESLLPGDTAEQDFTVVSEIAPLDRGSAAHGQVLYAEACAPCHGGMHTGDGRLSERLPILPEDTLAAHVGYTPRVQRLIFTEKIRHGGFRGYGGVMPPFSAERLSDTEVSDLLEALGVLGE